MERDLYSSLILVKLPNLVSEFTDNRKQGIIKQVSNVRERETDTGAKILENQKII